MVKISIISPCLNGEGHLQPYIDGLLSQTYSNVELIFVNDGSTDKTEEIINSYAQEFRKKGWTFIYLKQPARGGQAKAINQGLKIFTGDYLCCIDSDDIILPTYLEDMSNFLEANQDCAIAFPWVEVIEENTQKHIKYFKRSISAHIQDTLFDDFILQRNHNENYIQYTSFMMRSQALLEIYPNRSIYEGLSGQNAQLILPVLYNYKCGYVEKVLYNAVARKNSDSRMETVQEFVNKTYSWEDIYVNVIRTIPNMPEYEKAYYFEFVKKYWELQRNKCLTSRKKRKLFSVTNEYKNSTKRKVVNILGLKLKFKTTKSPQISAAVERGRE